MQTRKYFLLALNFLLSSQIILCEVNDKKTSQFSYSYDTEVACNNQPGFELDLRIEDFSYFLNSHLNNSTMFDSSLIRNAKKAREYHVKKKPNAKNIGELYEATTSDGFSIECTFFDRGSDMLLVVFGGFTNEREIMSPFIDIFPDYDIVICEFRGHGYVPFNFLDPSSWPLNFSKHFFGVDTKVSSIGDKEHNDVFAIVHGFKKLKQYRCVFGLGICYGAFIFAKAAAIWPNLFDKIVLDGCWLSRLRFIDKIRADVKTICNPQTGGWSDHWFWSRSCVKRIIEFAASNILSLNLSDDLSILDFAPKVKSTSLLFFYGKDDYMITRDEFETLWDAFDISEKTAIITSNPHVLNHLKQKELYKLICDLFFECSQEKFIDLLLDANKLVEYHTNKFMRFKF
jgi:pimeloyl-ACP methyl ester carboxylesterase